MIITISVAVAVLLAAIGIGTYFYLDATKDDGLIYSNVYAQDLNLGGMTPEEATAALNALVEETYAQKSLTIELPDGSLLLTPSSTDVTLDVDKLIEDAYAYGRSGSRWERTQARAAAALSRHNMDIMAYLTVNTSYITQVIQQIADTAASELTQTEIVIEGTMPDLNRTFEEASKDEAVEHMVMKVVMGTPYRNLNVGDLVDQPIQAYRLTGEGVADLKIGDKITIEGIIKNYKGTIEFDKGCVLVGYGEIVSQKPVLEAAYKLEDGASMTAPTALEGEIVKIDTAYSEQYGNITVTIVCDGLTEMPIMCYRLKGDGAATLAVGDKIAVFGTIKNYKGTIEFDAGCQLIPYGSAKDVRILMAAYALEEGMSMEKPVTLTGVIHKIPTAYSPDYKNITVDMTIAGLVDYPIECYRLSGEGAETLAIGDTITVTGIIKNYKGLIEFDKGCTLDAVVKAVVPSPVAE